MRPSVTSKILSAFVASLTFGTSALAAGGALSTAFTYQGRLVHNGAPVTGEVNLSFALYDSREGGSQVGSSYIADGTQVADGLFDVCLDFGAAFGNSQVYLEIIVNGNALNPRQPVTAVPLALYALNGAVGPQGPAGADGNDGAPGADGEDGAPGTNGTNGAPGTNGTNGVDGATGPIGLTGATGSTGATGAQGATGAAGDSHWALNTSTNATYYTAGSVGIGASTTPDATLRVFGTAKASEFITAGADLAEEFPMSETVTPGMLVEIDAKNPGHLRRAVGEYNRRVAGVVAGANNFPTGLTLGQGSGNGTGAPIALSGRVYVYVDATTVAVEPGDLLTTSNKPGYAMAVVDHERMDGAVVGKAMTRMPRGKTGLVLVLINLQ